MFVFRRKHGFFAITYRYFQKDSSQNEVPKNFEMKPTGQKRFKFGVWLHKIVISKKPMSSGTFLLFGSLALTPKFTKRFMPIVPYSATFKFYFLALNEMNQQNGLKAIAVSSEQVDFLSTK